MQHFEVLCSITVVMSINSVYVQLAVTDALVLQRIGWIPPGYSLSKRLLI